MFILITKTCINLHIIDKTEVMKRTKTSESYKNYF